MEEPTESRRAGAEGLANGALEPEEAAPEVEVEVEVEEEEEPEEEPPRSATAKQEEAKAALGAEGSRPFTMRELLGELKEDGEAAATGSGGSSRSAFGDGNGIGSADAEGSSYRFVLRRVSLPRHFRSRSVYWITVTLVRFAALGF
jgi:membrane protein involved in colicin uptake